MRIKRTIMVDVDVFKIPSDYYDDLDPGWYAVIRGDGADLWLGPYESKAEAIKMAKKRLSAKAEAIKMAKKRLSA